MQDPGIMFVPKQGAKSAQRSGTTAGQVTVMLVTQLQSKAIGELVS